MEVPALSVAGDWQNVLRNGGKAHLEKVLPAYLYSCRWFGGKARAIRSVEIQQAVPISYDSRVAYMSLARVRYEDGTPEIYTLPLAFLTGPEAERIESQAPDSVVARLTSSTAAGVIATPMRDRSFCLALLEAIGLRKSFTDSEGSEIWGTPTHAYARLAEARNGLEPALLGGEQSNSSIRYGDRLVLKLFRRLEEGVNPDLEIGAFLTEAGFAHVPAVGGALEIRRKEGKPITLAILQEFVHSRGDAWGLSLEELVHYYDRAALRLSERGRAAFAEPSLWDLLGQGPSTESEPLIGNYLEQAKLLGKRTAELHLALASDDLNPEFAPEPFSLAHQRALYESMEALAVKTFPLLEQRLSALPGDLREEARAVYALEPQVLDKFRSVLARKITAARTRVHGDYHLGQVLYTGRDFVIIDFEGEPTRSILERRAKRSPLLDVAGMVRSFHYAAYSALLSRTKANAQEYASLRGAAHHWFTAVSAAFVAEYLEVAAGAPFLPPQLEQVRSLLDVFQLEKAVYELGYELNNRPDWLRIPLAGIRHLAGVPAQPN